MRTTSIATTLISLFLLFLCTESIHASGITAINEINTSPANFDGKTVLLTGITKEPTRIPVIELKAYVLEDDTGEAIILTNQLPDMGKVITVRVRIENLAIINGEALGTTITELQRYE